MVDWTHTCIKNIASCNIAFLQELEDLSELRELFHFAGDFDQATGEEVNCFLATEVVAEVGFLDGNCLDEDREYPQKLVKLASQPRL